MKESTEIVPLVERAVLNVRDDLQDSPYIQEALKVLTVGGYRSAIGQFWNAVVDDLRNKIIFRGVHLFNQEISVGRDIKTYEDFQNYVNDDQLIDGAYKTGVIGWEASKVLRQAKETRHIFSGHPKSSDPSPIKVLAMMDDCIKYVLNQEYPTQLIDISDYLDILRSEDYDRNDVAIENAIGDLPEKYKTELVNRLFTVYIHPDSPSTLIGNIEFMVPYLWRTLPKDVKIQVIRRIDQEYPKGNVLITERAFQFSAVVKATRYLSASARKYKISPIVKKLKENLDEWSVEGECVKNLLPFSDVIPNELQSDYVSSLTHTYVGYIGSSSHFARRDFYSNGAAPYIPKMFEKFNDSMIGEFIETIISSDVLRRRLESPIKMRRLRSLGEICLERCSESFEHKDLLELLCDEENEEGFKKAIKALTKRSSGRA